MGQQLKPTQGITRWRNNSNTKSKGKKQSGEKNESERLGEKKIKKK
jgi:hypothetical protein